MGCNRTDFDADLHGYYNNYTLWLSDQAINDIEALVGMGGGAAAILKFLAGEGIKLEAATPPGVGTAIAGVIAIQLGAIKLANRGCGVKLDFYQVPHMALHFQKVWPQDGW